LLRQLTWERFAHCDVAQSVGKSHVIEKAAAIPTVIYFPNASEKLDGDEP
jgi:hypothetical protein